MKKFLLKTKEYISELSYPLFHTKNIKLKIFAWYFYTYVCIGIYSFLAMIVNILPESFLRTLLSEEILEQLDKLPLF